MPTFTVLIPTHDHGDLIRTAVESIVEQTVHDFELFVVGDGATPETKAAVHDLSRRVPELRFFDLPKEAGRCAANRHTALAEAKGEIVCYCDDDDFWLPEHLATMQELLAGADLAHTAQLFILPDFRATSFLAELSDPQIRRMMLDQPFNFFGPTVAGHTLAAYRRLPVGWAPAPPDVWNDLAMWRRFLQEPSIRTVSSRRLTAIHLPGSRREASSLDQRRAELRFWRAASRDREVRARLERLLMANPTLPVDLGGQRYEIEAPAEAILGFAPAAPRQARVF